MPDDNELMKKVKAGCRESFEYLVLKYRPNALAFAKRYVKCSEAAQDVVQESFASLYVNKDKYDNRCTFKTYLFSIVKNKSIDYLRKNKRLVFMEVIKEDENTPEEIFFKKEIRNIVREKIMKLNEDYKTALYLIEYEDMSYREAAEIMGKNLVQIKSVIYRARCKLKKMLEDVL